MSSKLKQTIWHSIYAILTFCLTYGYLYMWTVELSVASGHKLSMTWVLAGFVANRNLLPLLFIFVGWFFMTKFGSSAMQGWYFHLSQDTYSRAKLATYAIALSFIPTILGWLFFPDIIIVGYLLAFILAVAQVRTFRSGQHDHKTKKLERIVNISDYVLVVVTYFIQPHVFSQFCLIIVAKALAYPLLALAKKIKRIR